MPIDLSSFSGLPSRQYDRQVGGGFGATARDFGLDVLTTGFRAAEGVFDSVYGLADAAVGGALPEFFEDDIFGKPRTIGGGVLDTLLQFAVPFTGVTKALQGAKYIGTAAQAAAKSGVAAKAIGLGRSLAAGAIVDAVAFEGNEGRLSDLANQYGFGNVLTEFLATEEGDSEIEGRLKNAVEGLALGGLTEGLMTIFKGYRLYGKRTASPDGAAKWEAFTRDSKQLAKIHDSIEEHSSLDLYGARKEVGDARREAFDGDFAPPVSKRIIDAIEERVGLTKNPYMSVQGEVIRRFTDQFAPVIESIRLEFSQGRGERSSVDLTERVMRLSLDSVYRGRLDRDFIHETYHVLQDYVGKTTRAKLTRAYESARAAAERADPDLARRLESGDMTAQDYRFLNEDEWFAELATERTIDDIKKQMLGAAEPAVVGFVAKARYAMQAVFDMFRGFYGEDVIQVALNDLRANKTLRGGELPLNREVRKAFADFNPEVNTARILGEGYPNFQYSMEARFGSNRPRGAANFFRRLELETNVEGGGRPELERVRKFVDDIGPEHFDDLGISINKKLTSASGRYEFHTSVIRLAKDTITSGVLDRVAIHEMWHKLSTHLPDADVSAVRASYAKAVAKEPILARLNSLGDKTIDANGYKDLVEEFGRDAVNRFIRPTNGSGAGREYSRYWTEETYRLSNEDEWFAENLTDAAMGRLDYLERAAASGSAKRIFQDLAVLVRELFLYASEKLGFSGPFPRIYRDFLKGSNRNVRRFEPLAGEALEADMKRLAPPDSAGPEPVLGFSDEAVQARVLDPLDQAIAKNRVAIENRNKLPESQRARIPLNMVNIDVDLEDGANTAELMFQAVLGAEARGADSQTIEAMVQEGIAATVKMTGLDEQALTTAALAKIGARNLSNADALRRARARIYADATFALNFAQKLVRDYRGKGGAANVSQTEKAAFAHAFTELGTAVTAIARVRGQYGRTLVSFRAKLQSFEQLRKLRGQTPDVRIPPRPEGAVKPETPEAGVKPEAPEAATPDAAPTPEAVVTPDEAAPVVPPQPVAPGAKTTPKDSTDIPEAVLDFVNKHGGWGAVDDLWNLFQKLVDLHGDDLPEMMTKVGKTAREQSGNRRLAGFMDYYYFALLSHPKTTVTAALGNALNYIWQPLSQLAGSAVAGGLSALPGANKAALRSAAKDGAIGSLLYMRGAIRGWSEIFSYTAKAFKNNASFLAPNSSVFDPTAPVTAVGSGFGRMLQLPQKALTAVDEAFKQAHYRSIVWSDSWLAGRRSGLEGSDLLSHADDAVKQLVVDGAAQTTEGMIETVARKMVEAQPALRSQPDVLAEQAAKVVYDWQKQHPEMSALAQKAKELSEVYTFTNRIDKNSALGFVGSKIQEVQQKLPSTVIFLPFVKTPINILQSIFDHTVGHSQVTRLGNLLAETFPKFGERLDSYVTKQRFGSTFFREASSVLEIQRGQFRGLMSQDPAIVMREFGKLSTALGAASILAAAAEAGMVTGALPDNKTERDALLARGIRPYSFKIGDTYVSYARLDPFAGMIGLVADTVSFASRDIDPQTSPVHDVVTGLISAVGNQLTEKSYFQGLSNIIDGLSDETKLWKLIQTPIVAAASPGALKAVRDLTMPAFDDPALKELHTVWSRIKDRLPGFSATLPDRRNFLGEPVLRHNNKLDATLAFSSPVVFSTVSNDLIAKEVDLLRYSFQPPKDIVAGISLHSIQVGGTTAYDRYGQLIGQVRINGRTIREEMERTIRSAPYQRMSPESTLVTDSPRVNVLRSIVERYRRKAYRQLLVESPEIDRAERQVANLTRLAKAGIAVQ